MQQLEFTAVNEDVIQNWLSDEIGRRDINMSLALEEGHYTSS